MPTKPKYIQQLEEDVSKLKADARENRDNQDKIMEIQAETLEKLHEIHICLAGTEFDKNQNNGSGGGVVKRLGRVEKLCDQFNNWKTRMATRDAIIWIVVGGALTAIWSIIIANWQTIFHTNL